VVFTRLGRGEGHFLEQNEGNKRNLAESKTDLVGTLRKKQRNIGRYEAMKYFMQDDVKRLSWSAPICNDGKVDSKDGAIADGGIFVSSSSVCYVRMFGVGKSSDYSNLVKKGGGLDWRSTYSEMSLPTFLGTGVYTTLRGSSPAFLAGKKTSTFFSDKTSHA
jgi:hypothetical protein